MQGALENQPHLHIVCYDNPYPPNYGGVIDVYYKIKALYELGTKIILHVYVYGKREIKPELTAICDQVYYYRRQKSIAAVFSMKPFIVKTRASKDLLNNLLKDSNPILLEGLHCTAFLKQLSINNRPIAVRCHNIEHHYYQHFSQATRNPLNWLYFKIEAFKLKRYEAVLKYASQLYAISPADHAYFNGKYQTSNIIPPFHPYKEQCKSTAGLGQYILIHGNLSVLENEKSVLYLIKKVLSKLNYPTIIAGQSPSQCIKNKITHHPHIQLIENPTSSKMSQLIENSQLILLHTHQETGIKLKLIYSLFEGRHIICNSKMVNNTGLESLCHIVVNDNQWIKTIHSLWQLEFSEDETQERYHLLTTNYNTRSSATIILNTLVKN